VDLEELEASRAEDERALAEVAERLAELVVPLGVTPDASAEEVNRSIEAQRSLEQLAEKRADAEGRARLAGVEIQSFEDDLRRALADLAPDVDLGSVSLRDAALTLFQRGAAAKDNARELSELELQLAEVGPELSITDAERQLVLDPAALAAHEQDLAERSDEVEREITLLNQNIGGYKIGFEKMRAESNAAEAAAVAQASLARVRENAARWSRVKLAMVILAREIERYRDENQAPLLASASSLFARLTLGAFSGVKAGFDDKDKPCLRCLRAQKDAEAVEVDVSGLSDGTRDQLYLALRLASLLRRAEVSEPMPLVLDDALIQLDDQRASAALAVLAEVAEKMQVLFFTHHARLVELARAAVPAGQLVVHELAGSSPAAAHAGI
jgi:uncharacterized protein YhaN